MCWILAVRYKDLQFVFNSSSTPHSPASPLRHSTTPPGTPFRLHIRNPDPSSSSNLSNSDLSKTGPSNCNNPSESREVDPSNTSKPQLTSESASNPQPLSDSTDDPLHSGSTSKPHRPRSRTPCHPTPRPVTQVAQRAQPAAHLRQQEGSRTITCRTRHSPSACLTTPMCAAWGRSKVRGQGVAKESSDAERGKGGGGDKGRGGVRFYDCISAAIGIYV